MRDSFVIYANYGRKTQKLSMEQRGFLFTAILAYECGEELPELDDMTATAFEFIKDDLDANRQRYEAVCEKNRENANKRWQDRKKSDATACDRNRMDANHAEHEHDNEHEHEHEHECVVNTARARAREDTHDTPDDTTSKNDVIRIPTIDAVADENAERGYGLTFESMQGFMEYNKSRSWRMDWKTALKKWAEKEHKGKPPDNKGKKNAFTNFENQHSYDFDALERTILSKPPIGGAHGAVNTG